MFLRHKLCKKWRQDSCPVFVLYLSFLLVNPYLPTYRSNVSLVSVLSLSLSHPVLPVKSGQMSFKVAQKLYHKKMIDFETFLKIVLQCGHFVQNNCFNRLWKVAHSGHTAPPLFPYLRYFCYLISEWFCLDLFKRFFGEKKIWVKTNFADWLLLPTQNVFLCLSTFSRNFLSQVNSKVYLQMLLRYQTLTTYWYSNYLLGKAKRLHRVL